MSNTNKSHYRMADEAGNVNRAITTENRKEFEALEHSFDDAPDLICLSHLRWDFVYQRPQHLLSRCARDRGVFFVEEPVLDDDGLRLELTRRDGVTLAVPHLPEGLSPETAEAFQRAL